MHVYVYMTSSVHCPPYTCTYAAPPPPGLSRSGTEMHSCSTIVYSRDAGLYHGWDIRQH